MNIKKTSLALLVLGLTTGAQASTLGEARHLESSMNKASANSQTIIDRSAESTLSMKAEIEQLQEEVQNLQVYRDHLANLVDSQNQEKASLNQQIEGIKDTRQGVVPLMYSMLNGLKANVEADKPIRREQRLTRIAKLEKMMVQADISDAEKYRRILEAYQIELDYGTKMGIYQGQVALETGSIEADMLYLGRISLVARSLDGTKYWSWNEKDSVWQSLDGSFASGINKAFAIASNQAAPSLIALPVSVNVETK
ncbi:DUF3450 domain-containing protein [Photobacterium sp. DNB23_23_1]|uniref:DUF3450 domain-containing protein n=1 Tax=Photobacterium pectinilyticum TaxID=2906793 RepID=A0ABT1N6G0_9GAMM|nr:DUF3450 domain-containing protein [Photobacterium sp. ZSDE20]MCQ1060335.1 DUF3450 domain-containing protein [Photobacterium sp. ZSDE20]MDD1827658.1 DUF3450 domain-containing protein [Photobacterium sp. ZSDE20]